MITVKTFDKDLATELLALWEPQQRNLKKYRKHLERIGAGTVTVDAEIRLLTDVIYQVHLVRRQRNETGQQAHG